MIVAQQDPGPRAWQWRLALQNAWLHRGLWYWLSQPLAALYGVVTGIRQLLYQQGICKTYALPVPVIVVGNLVAGGAGKTPTVMAVVETLRRHGYRPGVVSRGYGRNSCKVQEVLLGSAAQLAGDEPLLIKRRLGDEVPVFVGCKRVQAARALLARYAQTDCLVFDDGLQHWALGRDVSVLVIDERGWGNGALLPSGPLRQRPPASTPAATLVLYNALSVTTALPGTLAVSRLAALIPLEQWSPNWPSAQPIDETLEQLRQSGAEQGGWYAAAGMARPERFFGLLERHELNLQRLPLRDHFGFAQCPWPLTTQGVVVTEKDAIKLQQQPWVAQQAAQVWVARLGFELSDECQAQLLKLMHKDKTYGQPSD
jgi:tetraacyldisaccharide 4'-kinase